MSSVYDVIIIGAGLGGLAAAARLARAGKQVLLLEQSAQTGGYARGLQQGDFYFDFSLHCMDGVSPGGWSHLTLSRLGVLDEVVFDQLDPYYEARFPGREFQAHANPFEYEAELIRQFPKEANGIRSLLDEMVEIYRDAHRGRVDHALERYPPPEEMLRLHPSIVRAVRETWADLLARHVESPELKAVLSAPWCYCGLPPSRLSSAGLALLLASAHYYGAYYPRGGSQALNQALEKIIRAGGGQICCQQKVTKIHIEEGLAAAVETDQGLYAQARVLISNLSAPATFLDLIAPENLPLGYTNRISATPPSLSSFNIYLGLDRDLASEGWPHHQTLIAESYNADEQYDAILAGDWQKAPFLLAHHTKTYPQNAPPGKSTLVLMSLAPWDYQNVWGTGGDLANYRENALYQQTKEAVAETFLTRLEQYLPGLESSICYKEVATPITNVRYTLNQGGAIFGSEQSAANMYLSRLNEETPIPNLFLAGAWTIPGGGQSASLLSGYDAAGHSLLYLDNKPREVTFFAAVQTPDQQSPTAYTHSRAAVDGLKPGQQAPDFLLEAVTSGRLLNLQTCQGVPLVFLFVTQNTLSAIQAINDAARSQFPLATQVVVACVFDFGKVPPLFHKMINLVLKRAYAQAAKELPEGLDAADYVILLPDWSGKTCQAYQIQGADKTASAVVIDRVGQVQGVFQGEGFAEAVVDTLKWL